MLWAFRDRVNDLKNDRRLRYVMLFKNQGEAAGATLEHTHSQLIALPVVPKRVQEEVEGAKAYYDFKERCIFCDLIRQEAKSRARIVTETDRFVVLEPYAARFPFETWIMPKQHKSHFEDADSSSLENLAWVLRSTLRKIEKVLEWPPYNFLIHTAPLQEAANPYFHWHIEVIPKLTRVAGFEWGSGFLHQSHAAGRVGAVPARRRGLLGRYGIIASTAADLRALVPAVSTALTS